MTGHDIRVDRTNRGLTIAEFASEIGVAAHVLKYAENGGRPTHGNAKTIADFYGVKVTDMWPVEEVVT